MAPVQFVTLLCFALIVPCQSSSCLMQRNATHHSVEPRNEDLNHPALALVASRQTHAIHTHNEPAGHGHGDEPPAAAAPAPDAAAAAADDGHGGKKAKAAKFDVTAALRIQLSMPMTIREIHEGPQGPLSKFLVTLHQQLCKSTGVPAKRISLLGIRGEYTKLETMLLDSSTLDGKGEILLLDNNQDKQELDWENTHAEVALESNDPHAAHADPHAAPADPHAAPADSPAEPEAATNKEGAADPAAASPDHEVIVDMEILPGETAGFSGEEVYEKIKQALEDPKSALMTGAVGGMLKKAELTLGKSPNSKDSDQQKAKEGHALGVVPNMMLLSLLASLSYGYM